MKKRKKIFSTLLISSCLANQPISVVLAEELKDIDIKNIEQTKESKNINIEQTKENKDVKLKDNKLYEVYLDGSKEVSGSGETADSAVNNLKAALDLVAHCGVIYATGEVVVPDDLHMPEKIVYIEPQKGKEKGKLKFEKKLYIHSMLHIKDMEIEFSSNDKDCIFLNGNYLEIKNTPIIGKPNIFIGSENEDVTSDTSGSLNIINDNLNNDAIGNINLGGKNGHTVEKSSVYIAGVTIDGVVDGKNAKEISVIDIGDLSNINKIQNVKKVNIYGEATLNIESDVENITEFYCNGGIKIKNGSKINAEYIYGTFSFDIEVPDNETIIEGNYLKSKKFVGEVLLSDKLIREGYRINTIRWQNSAVSDLINQHKSNITTNYAPTINNLMRVIINEGNTIDLKKGIEAWDFEDGDITEKIVFPKNNLKSLPVGIHEVPYEVTDSNGNKTVANRVIHVIPSSSPIINGVENITIKVGDVDKFDLLEGVTVKDNRDNNLKPTVTGQIKKPAPGNNKDSIITYTVTDSDKNTTTETRVITVTNQLPVISGLDKIVTKKGKPVDLLSGVSASDEEDGNITNNIVRIGNVDINKEGEYKLIYKVTDSDGNTTQKERLVVVEANDEVVPPEVEKPESKPPVVAPPEVEKPEVEPPVVAPPEVEKPEVEPPAVVPPEVEDLLPSTIVEAINNNLINLNSGAGTADNPLDIEFNNISDEKVDNLLSNIKNLNTEVKSFENKDGYTFVNIKIINNSKYKNFKANDSNNLTEEIHIVLKVKDEYSNIADKLTEFAKNNIADSNDDIKLIDIDGHWASKEINDFISKGYISGYPEDNTFRPNNSITRAEFVKIVNKYFGFTEGSNSSFDDVLPSQWYYKDIAIAEKAGYINGRSEHYFDPDSPITREEAAKIVTTITGTLDHNHDKLNKFVDGYKVSDWAKSYVEGALEQGYLIGNEQGLVNPVNNITRAESVVMLSRINQKKHNVSNFKTI
nr:S-layer homology domain-containing protein [uncultured Romboutsia sp.]